MPSLRVVGKVSEAAIEYRVQPDILLAFSISDPDISKDSQKPLPAADVTRSTIRVRYAGIKPDMFAAGRQVIIDGEWKDDVFIAHKLLTQCPSKYEPPTLEPSTLEQAVKSPS